MIAKDQLGKPCGSLTRLAFSPNISNEVVPEYEVNLCLLSVLWLMVISFIKLKIKSAKLNYTETACSMSMITVPKNIALSV